MAKQTDQTDQTVQTEQARQTEPAAEVVKISVRNLVEFILRSGDIDNRFSSGSDKDAMQLGSRLHRKLQGRGGPTYRSEVSLKEDFPCDDFLIRVEGRADGIYEEDVSKQSYEREILPEDGDGPDTAALTDLLREGEDLTVIDEIKGMMRDVTRLEEPLPVHLAQAKCYAYIYSLQENLPVIGVRMSYGNLETEQMRYFRYIYRAEELETWFEAVLEEYRKWARFERSWHVLRQESIKNVKFPFAYREGQKQLAGDVYRTISRGRILFVQAPTGVGKTITTVFPAVMAVGQGLGEKIFYLTAKTIARTVAAEAFNTLRQQGLRYKTVILTAKEKICPLDQPECNPDACPYAKGHFDRINSALYELITTQDPFDRQNLQGAAEQYRVCPFELQLDLTLWADAVIGDYNYVFDPRAKLRRFFGEGVKGDYLFLVDEAHNLVDRGREMYSASLYKEDFLALKREVAKTVPRMAKALERCNRKFLELKRACEGEYQELTSIGTLPVALTNLQGVMSEWLEDEKSPRQGLLREQVLDLYFSLGTFLETCDVLDEHYVMYTQNLADGRFMLKLFCVDPSANLQACLDRARSTIEFSATFLPIGYYKSLLSTRTDNYAVYAKSCFDPRRAQILIGRDTSSRYRLRSPEQYGVMASYIHRIVEAKSGNYLVFFSSYRMLEDVAEVFRDMMGPGTELLCQNPGMREAEREAFLEAFTPDRQGSLVGFCVMGSIFGEGIDLKEDRLIGTVIVGCGLPQVCAEVKILQNYYDKRGMDGFRYAYQYPGMNKVLQAAGRVIRTETDRGVVVLLDERFTRSEYREMYPREWQRLQTVTLPRLEASLRDFWEEEL